MSVEEKEQVYSYAGVHRDIAAGMMAGDLMRTGYFGKVVEAFGILCQLEDKTILLYGFDAVSLSLQAYKYLQQGVKISNMVTQSYQLAIEESEKNVVEPFKQYVSEIHPFNEAVFVKTIDDCNVWAGFSYEEEGKRQEFINGYFPRVLEKYIAVLDKKASPIVFKEKFDLAADKKQLRQEVHEMLAETVN